MMIKSKITSLLLLWSILLLLPLTLLAGQSSNVIIPKPQKFHTGKGYFVLNSDTHYISDTTLSVNAIRYLQDHLKKTAGYTLHKGKGAKTLIQFHFTSRKIKHSEGYKLSISKKKITIEAKDSAGFFYGIVSLMQLMDPAIWGKGTKKSTWSIPVCSIEDYPRFRWRGLMLDSSRNFFTTSYVKKFIDRMAQHKLNRFHWHLTDDEGCVLRLKSILY